MTIGDLKQKAQIIVDEYFHEYTEGRLDDKGMVGAIMNFGKEYHEAFKGIENACCNCIYVHAKVGEMPCRVCYRYDKWEPIR